MTESVDVGDLKSPGESCASSNLAPSTIVHILPDRLTVRQVAVNHPRNHCRFESYSGSQFTTFRITLNTKQRKINHA